MAIKFKIKDSGPVKFHINSGATIFRTNMAIVAKPMDVYEESYEFTPSASTQIIPVKDKTPYADITINPIPNNYGLITWNGATLTVS